MYGPLAYPAVYDDPPEISWGTLLDDDGQGATVIGQIDVFRSRRGAAFAFRNDMPAADGDLLYSRDGVTFREMGAHGFAGNGCDFKLDFEDPRDRRFHTLHKNDGVLYFEGDVFFPATPIWEDRLRVAPLPPIREPEYLFASLDLAGPVIYVSDSHYKRSYDWHFFIGRPPALGRVPVRNVLRARDGGTTTVTTDAGVLYSPTPWQPERVATWNGRPLRKLDPKACTIQEDGLVAWIAPRPRTAR
jgi:hypothetical protein